MSWEDCGFKPGKIHGPAKCPRQCSDCDGDHHFYVDSSHCSEESPDAMRFACKHCDATAEMVCEDELQSPYPLDDEDSPCPKCGSFEVEWIQCDDCGGEGDHDLYEEDPVNYAEGEEYEMCQLCQGKGGWIECHACQRKAEAERQSRIEAQTLPLFATPEGM